MWSNKGRDPVERGPGSLGKLRLRRAQHPAITSPAGETPAPRLVSRLVEPRSHSLRLRSFGASGPFPIGPKGSFYVNVKIKPKGRAEPPKATAKPYSRHILGIYSGGQSHLKATPKPFGRQAVGNRLGTQSHPNASSKPPQSHILGNTEPPQSHTKATPKP